MTATYWLVIGFIGQIAFGARFAGRVILLTYAIHREDPVFILGQSLGSIIYVRNLILIDRKKKSLSETNQNNE